MNEEFKLSDIKIGFTDGAREAEESNFLDIFYNENKKYEQISKNHNFIICGRKGTGKTILAKYYQKMNNKGSTIVEYTKLNEISLHEYIDIDTPLLNHDTRILFQEFYIYKQFLMTILDHKLLIRNFFEDGFKFRTIIPNLVRYIKYKNMYSYAEEFYRSRYPDGPYSEKEIRNIKSIVESSNGSFSTATPVEFQVGGSESFSTTREITLQKKTYYETLDEFKRIVIDFLEVINITLIIDDVDEIKIDDQEHLIMFLLSLVTKINDINLKISRVNKNSKCIVLLRSDIVNMFNSRSSNIQKILSDSMVEILWFKDNSGDELSDMIMYKIKNSTNSVYLKNLSPKEIRARLFPTVDKSQGYDSFEYMQTHSFGRPRDLITFIDTVIKQFPNNDKFTLQTIKEAEAVYSNKFYSELRNEMSLILSSDAINDIENLLRAYGKRNFGYNEFKNYYMENADKYKSIYDIDETLQYLYRLGAIGTFRKIKRVGKVYSWSYRNGGDYINKENRITIHQGLYKALNI